MIKLILAKELQMHCMSNANKGAIGVSLGFSSEDSEGGVRLSLISYSSRIESSCPEIIHVLM